MSLDSPEALLPRASVSHDGHPDTGAPARGPQVSRRPVAAGDDGYLRRLFAQSRDDLLALPAEVRGGLLDMQYRGQRRQFAAGHPGASHEVLVADGTDAGLLILDSGAGRVHVVDITVARERRRQGIASAALRAVIGEAGERPVTLSVWAGNVIARSLYERLGFAASGTDTGSGYISMEYRSGR
jgi:ribosomal protein S18 acetylase RimI-like enzyme